MDCISSVLEKLTYRDIKATVNEFEITWVDYMDYENYIQLGNIDCNADNLAWLQSNEKDEYLLRVYEGDESFDWKPITYNPYFGCTCILLEWYKDSLIFIYSEKHDTYICSIKNKEVKTLNFSSHKLSKQGNIIFIPTEADENTIRRIQLPGLEELEPVSKHYAEQQGVLLEIPFGVNPLRNK